MGRNMQKQRIPRMRTGPAMHQQRVPGVRMDLNMHQQINGTTVGITKTPTNASTPRQRSQMCGLPFTDGGSIAFTTGAMLMNGLNKILEACSRIDAMSAVSATFGHTNEMSAQFSIVW